MKLAKCSSLFVAGILSALSFACSSDPKEEGVPEELDTVEGTAEDAYDQALAGHPDLVAKDAQTLDTTWKAFRPTAIEDGVSEADAVALDQAIAGLLAATAAGTVGPELARAANAVSEPMSDLYTPFEPAVPAPVLRLDYLGRELELDGLESDLAGAQGHVDALDATWKALRASVVSAGGTKQAADYDASVTSERDAITASDAAALSAAAHTQLDLVDAIEQVYATADAPD